jgi:hypothetical protein
MEFTWQCNVSSDTNHRNNSFISVFSGFIFTQGSAVGIETRHARKLRRQYVCSWHFSATDFTLAYETCLDRFGVPNLCTAVSLLHSAKHHEEPSLNSLSSEKTFISWSLPIPIQSDISLPSAVFSYQLLQEETITFSKKRQLLSTWLCKWRCFKWRSQNHQPS